MSATGITLITLDYPPEKGGVARYLGELVRASEGGIDTVIVEQNHVLSGPGSVIPRELFWHAWPKWGPMIRVCLEHRTSCALLISHLLPVGTAAMIARWLGGAPYAVICHGLDVRLAASHPSKKFIADLIFRNADLVIANSISTAAMIKTITPTLQALVLTPGVTIHGAASKEAARMKLGIGADEEVILAVGRVIKRKGFDLLLEATERLNDREHVRTVIVGEGPELATLKQLAEHLKHRVTFIADAKDEDVALWYAAADVFCMPARESATDVEGFGIVFLEAAAHGVPVVATTVGGIGEAVVDGETGVLVPTDDVEKLAEELRRLLADPNLRSLLGNAGRERVLSDFRWRSRWERLNKALKGA